MGRKLTRSSRCIQLARAAGKLGLVFFSPASPGHYYVRAENRDGELFGAGSDYTVHIEQVEKGCEQDNYEPDNDIAGAQRLAIDSSKQTHNICPRADADWTVVQATPGIPFTVETRGLASASDTLLCLHDGEGREVLCDRDSGAGLGSRIVVENPLDNSYVFSVTNEDPEVAGTETRYQIRAIKGLCQPDKHEPDNTRHGASAAPTDGSLQGHNICGPDDADWVRFTASANTSYVIETSNVGPEGDTLVELYDATGTKLAGNDDYATGIASQLVYEAPSDGTYYAKVQAYSPKQYGDGTEYSLSIREGTVTPTPTPPPTPEPEITPTPPPSTEVRTLILVNRARMTELYGEVAEAQLMRKLDGLARSSRVQGEIIWLDNNAEVENAYRAWTGNETSVERANQVADTIRRVVMTYLDEWQGVEYLVLVGDDRALPFRRIADTTDLTPERSTLP